MAKEWTFEDPGEGIHEAEILAVKASEGDEVSDGDVVLEVETDKAAIEVPAPFSGAIEEIRVAEGDVLEVGDVLMTYTEAGESGEAAGAERAEEPAEEVGEGPEEPPADEDEGGDEEEAGAADRGPEETGAAAVGELPGPEEAAAEEEEPGADGESAGGEAEAEREEGAPAEPESPVPASPAARRIAGEEGVDLAAVEGSGPDGRITVDDVRAAAGEREEAAAPSEAEGAEATGAEAAGPARPERGKAPDLPDFERWGEVERIPFRSVRRTVARRMETAWERVPHVTHVDVADVTPLEEFRREYAPRVAEEGGDLSLTVLVVKAVVNALKEHPRFNASLDEEAGEIVLKRHYHVGVAVDTDRGLLVPVVRDADSKSLVEVAVETSRLVERARSGEIERDEMRGGTFTVTNPGPIGGTAFTPLVRWPEVAILGMAAARVEPVAVGDDPGTAKIVPARRLPLCLAFDHRVNDGADAARFVATIVDTLEDPESFVLHA